MKILNSYSYFEDKKKKIFICLINDQGKNIYKIIEPKLSIKFAKIDKFDEYKYIIKDPEEVFYIIGSDRSINLFEYSIKNKKYIKLNDLKIYRKYNGKIEGVDTESFLNEVQYLEGYKIMNKYYYFSYFDKIFKDLRNVDFDELRVGYFDIEVSSNGSFPVASEANYPISLIAISIANRDILEINTIINNEILHYENSNVMEDAIFDGIKNILGVKNIKLKIYNENCEGNVLRRFIYICNNVNILTGWNSISFDFKYLYNRAKKLNIKEFIDFFYPKNTNLFTIEKDIDRNKQDSFWKTNEIDTFEFSVLRIPNLDYNTLIKTALVNKSYPSYKLGYIAEKILGEGLTKINIDIYDWKKDIDLFVKYNIMDTLLVYGIEKKMNLLRFLFDLRKVVGYFPLNKISSNIILQTYIFNKMKSQEYSNYSILTDRKDKINEKLFKIYKRVNNYE